MTGTCDSSGFGLLLSLSLPYQVCLVCSIPYRIIISKNTRTSLRTDRMMQEEEKRTLEVHGKTYELYPHDGGVVVEVLGITYEIYENDRGGFEVNRVESDRYTAGIGNDLSSESAAIELAEIFERLHRFVRDNGYMSQLSELEWYLEQWKETPPIRNE